MGVMFSRFLSVAAPRPAVQKPVQESIIGRFPASAISRLSTADSIHPD